MAPNIIEFLSRGNTVHGEQPLTSPLKISLATMFIARPLRGLAKSVLKTSPIRLLSATTSVAARPRPRPAPKKPATTQLSRTPVEEQFPPVALLQAAKKSKALDIKPDTALNILRNYVELSTQRTQGTWEKQFCAGKSRDQFTTLL